MKMTLVGVLLILIGVLSMIGGATGAPILVAMFGGLRGRAPNTVLTRAGMAVGGLLSALLGGLVVSGYAAP